MTAPGTPSRRAFLKGGAVLAAPVVAASAVSTATRLDDGAAVRLARLESEAAIRALQADWLRRINAGDRIAAAALFVDPGLAVIADGLLAIAVPADADPHGIEVSADGRRAVGRVSCTVDIATALPRDCTLGLMAHAQGTGFVTARERRLLTIDYVGGATGWAIGRLDLATV